MEFNINIRVNAGSAVAGANKATTALANTEKRANSLQRSLVRAFLVFGAIRAVKNAVKTLANFDDAIKTVGAISGATANQLQKLSETAQQLGINTRFSAVEAAEGLVTLSRAGFSVVESQQAIAQVLDLAVAGATSLADAADITATVLRSFGIAASDSARVVDVLTKAANSANTTVTQLGQGIKFVGPIARGLGVSLELTTAALGTLSDAGLKATLAGTGFRRILAELESPTVRNIKRFKELGVTVDQVKISQVGLTGALEALADAGITTGDALRIFGQRGGPAFEVLIRNIERLKEFTRELENAAGAARDTAEAIDKSLKGALVRAESAYKGLIIALGDTGPTNGLTQAFNGLAASMRFVAENAEIAGAALLPIAGVGATLGAAKLLGFGAAVKAAAVPLIFFATILGIINLGLLEGEESAKQIREAFSNLDEDSGFAKLGADMETARREFQLLEDVIRKQKSGSFTPDGAKAGASDSQEARLKVLAARYLQAKFAIEDAAQAQKDLNEAQKTAPFDEVIAGLEREREIILGINDEKRTEIELDKILTGLEGKDFDASGPQKDTISAKLAANQALRDQQKILDEIDGPAKKFNKEQAILEALMIRFPGRAEEFKLALEDLRDELFGIEEADPFEKTILGLKQANELIDLRNRDANVAADAQEIFNARLASGLETTITQRRVIQGLVQDQADLNKITEEKNAKEREALKLIREESRLREKITNIIERNNGVAAQANVDFLVKLQELGDLSLSGLLSELSKLPDGPAALSAQIDVVRQQWEEGKIGALEYARSIEDLGKRGAKGIGVLEGAWATMIAVADEFASVLANEATNAIVDYVQTGEDKFKEFAESLITALLRIIVKLLIIKALESVGFGGAGTANNVSTAVGGKRHGGTVQPGRNFIVGEDGPELFTPGKTGAITPNTAAPAPIVNIQNVVVENSNMVPEAIASGNATESIITMLGQNKDKVNKVLGNT